MLRLPGCALVVGLLAAPAALAQEAGPAAERYMACRAAGDGVDQRLHEICELIDDNNRMLPDAASQPRRQAELRQSQATALLILGDTGDELAMRDSIAMARLAARYYDRDNTRPRWAGLQSMIGQAQTYLGSRGDLEARAAAPETLARAVATIRRDRQPDLWVSLQMALASAYVVRSQGDPDELRLAAAALQSALEVLRGPRYAERRARAEQRLADIYRALGEEPNPT
ncbi:MAG: hypothetical protein JNL81_03570 [Hyphomonadaceae bacterium]|nr:hypothetical protein [Hyphomonadaceae bacterium]